MQHHTVPIEKLSFGGAGLGHCNGKACFVPFTAPGDVVGIEVVVDKKSYMTGRMKKLYETSSLRIEPQCPIFGQCGGCNWQHIPYDVQSAQKQLIFAELLWRMGRIDTGLLEPLLPAPTPFHYRSRVQLKVHISGGKVHIGFFRLGSHFVIDLPGGCAIAHPAINAQMVRLREFVAAFPEPDKIPQIDVATGDGGKLLIIVHYIGCDTDRAISFTRTMRGVFGAEASLWLQTGRKSTLTRIDGADFLTYGVAGCSGAPDIRMRFSGGAFSQVNMSQNVELIRIVREWTALAGGEWVLDIYCGNGNFSIPLASRAATVYGMEDYEPSVRDANENCRANGIGNAVYVCSDAASGVKRLVDQGQTFNVVVIDPPRSGAKDLVGLLPRLRPEKVIYVSCDPATLARDIGIMRKGGFDVVKSRPIDMFPQTFHLESVTLLQPHLD